MAIYRLIQNTVFEPKDIERLVTATNGPWSRCGHRRLRRSWEPEPFISAALRDHPIEREFNKVFMTTSKEGKQAAELRQGAQPACYCVSGLGRYCCKSLFRLANENSRRTSPRQPAFFQWRISS